MVLIVERRDTGLAFTPADPGPRSLERALRHMHWHFVAADASPLLRRRPTPLPSPRTAQEAP